jgi:hypothetical protein
MTLREWREACASSIPSARTTKNAYATLSFASRLRANCYVLRLVEQLARYVVLAASQQLQLVR